MPRYYTPDCVLVARRKEPADAIDDIRRRNRCGGLSLILRDNDQRWIVLNAARAADAIGIGQ